MRETNTPQLHLLRKGFTLIELLVVIAVLGILAAVVLVALDPLEQISRGRDSGRISAVAQVGHAVQAYATSVGDYPDATPDWQDTLVTAGEIKKVVEVPETDPNCGGAANNMSGAICYQANGTTDVVVWTVLESKNSRSRTDDCPEGSYVVTMYTTVKGQAGLACVTNPATITGNEEPLK